MRGFRGWLTSALLAALFAGAASFAQAQSSTDWITGLPREPIHVQSWPGGKKVAVCFIFDVEVWGHGQGPNFRPDTASRTPDVVDESFREYAINFGGHGLHPSSSKRACPSASHSMRCFPASAPMSGSGFASWHPMRPSSPTA
jgi:hypothetical protein